MGSYDYLYANTHYPRTVVLEQAFYSVFKQSRKQILAGMRPRELADVDTIDQKTLRKHRVHLARLESFPLKKVAFYQRLKESTGIQTVRGLSEITGEDWSYIAKLLSTLDLPLGIRDFLIKNPSLEIVKHFHLRRLLEIVRIKDEKQQMTRFSEIVSKLQISEMHFESPTR